MRNYEVTFVVDPVLSGDEVKATVQAYTDLIKQNGCTIVHLDEMGLKQLAYQIKKKHSGFYFCVEFQGESPALIDKMELALKRDERILRFLTIALDKFGVKYNDDKRKGLIGKLKKVKDEKPEAPAPVVQAAPTAAQAAPVALAAPEVQAVPEVLAAPEVVIPDLPEKIVAEEE